MFCYSIFLHFEELDDTFKHSLAFAILAPSSVHTNNQVVATTMFAVHLVKFVRYIKLLKPISFLKVRK